MATAATSCTDGSPKVMAPQMLLGHLFAMATGAKSTPKGGHAADLESRAATELATACGPRSQMRCARAQTAAAARADRLLTCEFLV